MPELTSNTPSDGAVTDRTVLFVDDEPELLDIYEIKYGSEYEVLTAGSGTEALEKFGEHVDIAFFDRRMPRMSGDEAIRALRENGYQTPIGIISAVEPETEIEVEYDVYLTKPIDEDRIRSTIDQYTP